MEDTALTPGIHGLPKFCEWGWSAEEVALSPGDPEVFQRAEFVGLLHALGDDLGAPSPPGRTGGPLTAAPGT
jgi:hypothetical protein